MDFESLVHRFAILFSFCGTSPFSASVKSMGRRKTRFGEFFPAIFYLLLVVGLFSISIRHRVNYPFAIGLVSTIVAYTHMSSEVFLQLTAIGPSFFSRKNLQKLCRTYNFIQEYMQKRLGHTVEFKQFQKRIYHLIATVFLPHVTTLILRRAFVKSYANFFSVSDNILAFFYLLSGIVQLHVIVHIEFLNFFLALTEQWLRKQTFDFSATSMYQRKDLLKMQQLNGYAEILHLKLIHFKLWEVSMHINRIYGWSLGAIILQNSIDIGYRAYWTYMHVVLGAKFLVWIRMLSNIC